MRKFKKLFAIALASLTILTSSAFSVSAETPVVKTATATSSAFVFTPDTKYQTFYVGGAEINTMLYIPSSGMLFYGIGSQQQNIYYDVSIIAHFKNSWSSFSSVIKTATSDTGFYIQENLNLNSSCTPPAGYTLDKIEARSRVVINGQSYTVSTYLQK